MYKFECYWKYNLKWYIFIKIYTVFHRKNSDHFTLPPTSLQHTFSEDKRKDNYQDTLTQKYLLNQIKFLVFIKVSKFVKLCFYHFKFDLKTAHGSYISLKVLKLEHPVQPAASEIQTNNTNFTYHVYYTYLYLIRIAPT